MNMKSRRWAAHLLREVRDRDPELHRFVERHLGTWLDRSVGDRPEPLPRRGFWDRVKGGQCPPRADRWADREARREAKRAERQRRHEDFHSRLGANLGFGPAPAGKRAPDADATHDPERAARRRARAVVGFQAHLTSYCAVICFLALVNLMTTLYPWFLWPAMAWGLGLFFHWFGVFGIRLLRDRVVEPVVEREVEMERAVAQNEKQASLDELSSTIAHEIRNPIAAAKSLVQQMEEDPTSVENVEYAKVALEELDRVERRVSHLLKYARDEELTFSLVNLASVVDAALTQMKSKLETGQIEVSRSYIGGPTVRADADKLRQVFSNAIDNAVDALATRPAERRLEIRLHNGGDRATVALRDNGCGIPADRVDRVFKPFYTTKEKGTGLGLAISRKIVEAHQGEMTVSSEAGVGTELRVSLPLPR